MKNDATRYALLTRLPLLQGISGRDLAAIEEHLSMDFDELPAHSLPFLRQGDRCDALIYLVEGKMRRIREICGIQIISHIEAPAVIEPEHLYGLDTTLSHTYYAETDVTLLSVRKYQLSTQLMRSEIFRLNLVNHLSSLVQKKDQELVPQIMGSNARTIQSVLRSLLYEQQGETELRIGMEQLAALSGLPRLNVSRTLSRWKEAGLLRLQRQHITIPDTQAFLSTSFD